MKKMIKVGKYRITPFAYKCYQISRWSKTKGWLAIKWPTTLQGAMRGVAHLMMSDAKITTGEMRSRYQYTAEHNPLITVDIPDLAKFEEQINELCDQLAEEVRAHWDD